MKILFALSLLPILALFLSASSIPLVANILVSPGSTVTSGQNVLLSASVSGGSAPYSYQWYASPYGLQETSWNNWNDSVLQGALLDSMQIGWNNTYSSASPASINSTAYLDNNSADYIEGNGSAALSINKVKWAVMLKYGLNANLASASNFYFWVLVQNASALNSNSTAIELEFANDQNYSQFFSCHIPGAILRNGWNPIVVSRSSCLSQGAQSASWLIPINSIAFKVYLNSNSSSTQLNFDNLRYNYGGGAQGKPTVMIDFDDGLESVMQNASSVINGDGLTATVFVLPGQVNSQGYLSQANLANLYNDGWNIAARATVNPLSGAPSSAQIENSLPILNGMGFKGSDAFLEFPTSNYNYQDISDAKSAGYELSDYQTTSQLMQPNLYPNYPSNLTYQIRSMQITSSSSLGNITQIINQTIAQRGLLILDFNQIDANQSKVANNPSAYGLVNFSIIASYLKRQQDAGQVIVTNFSSYYSGLNQVIAGQGGSSISIQPTSNEYYYYKVSDSNGTVAYSRPQLIRAQASLNPTIAISNTTISAAQNVIISATIHNSTGPFVYHYRIFDTSGAVVSNIIYITYSTSNSLIWNPPLGLLSDKIYLANVTVQTTPSNLQSSSRRIILYRFTPPTTTVNATTSAGATTSGSLLNQSATTPLPTLNRKDIEYLAVLLVIAIVFSQIIVVIMRKRARAHVPNF